MGFLRKKKTVKFNALNWMLSFAAFAGLLVIALLLLIENESGRPLANPLLFIIPVILLSILFIIGFTRQYNDSRQKERAISELTQSISKVEGEAAASMLTEHLEEADIQSISAILNHSLESLNEKNNKLKAEMERNERLSENISEFYRQMRTLREADLKFDFFEYDIKQESFSFISGMITAALCGDAESNEIEARRLFEDYNANVHLEDFIKQAQKSLWEDTPFCLECSFANQSKRLWFRFWGQPNKDKTRITGAITDITREMDERNIEKERAIRDNITGFYNRNALSEVAGKAIAECKPGESVVFVYIGLTGYQEFQERFGMVSGNTYIRECAEVFKKFLQDSIIPFRWWGSDFLALIKGIKDIEYFRKEAISAISKVEKYIGDVDGIAVTFPLAVGYAVSGIHGDTPAELLEYASFAEHEALREVAMSPNEFNRERYDEARRASLRRTFIKDILDRNQLYVVFQPIVSLRTGELFGFEALSRPANPMYRSILELIDDAEASGHYAILEKRMVYNALDTYMDRHEKFKDHYLFINTAPYATLDEIDYNDIRDRYFGHMKVVFEVIERNRMDPEEINRRKSIVTKAGAKFALDDFGSGYSNHLALLALEPDIIKIDRELVRGIDSDLRKQHMLEDIISYARYRGTRVLAEGVETKEELETLCRMGIDYAQGYYTGRPNENLQEPDPNIQQFIKGISHNNQLTMKQVYIIIEKALAVKSAELSRNMAITTYLVMKMGKRLGYKNEKLIGLVITTLFHDIGALYPGCEKWKTGECEEISGHSLYGYFLLKEFLPYSEYVAVVLYHHIKANTPKQRVDSIDIPDESYLLALADGMAGLIMTEPQEGLKQLLLDELASARYKEEYAEVMKDLIEGGILNGLASGDYRDNLLDYMQSLKLGKAEIESVLRTFIYGITFRSKYYYAHARTMESMVSLMSRMTKQNWTLVEKARIAALLYNIGMLTTDEHLLEEARTPEEEHRLFGEALNRVSSIVEEADLLDIMDMFNGVSGEKTPSESRMLMGKDILNGAYMLNLADVFSILIEKRSHRSEMTCQEALEEIKRNIEKYKVYRPVTDIIEDFIEDFEARVNSNRSDMEKRYQNVISNFEAFQDSISGNG